MGTIFFSLWNDQAGYVAHKPPSLSVLGSAGSPHTARVLVELLEPGLLGLPALGSAEGAVLFQSDEEAPRLVPLLGGQQTHQRVLGQTKEVWEGRRFGVAG